jgi:glycine betaine catabolism B
MQAKFVLCEQLAPQIYQFWFDPERGMRFEPGQYLDMTLVHDNPDSRGQTRTLSLTNIPSDDLLAFTTKIPDDASSFKTALIEMPHGDQVKLAEPMGDFILPKNPDVPLVFLAAGVGIAPYASMLKSLIDKNQQRNIQLIYIARDQNNMPFIDLVDSLEWVKTTKIFTCERPRPSASELLKIIKPSSQKLIYLAGSELMMENYWLQFMQQGVNRQQMILDFFPGYK